MKTTVIPRNNPVICADDSDRMPNTLTVNTSGGGVKQRQPHCGTCAVAKITSAEQPPRGVRKSSDPFTAHSTGNVA